MTDFYLPDRLVVVVLFIDRDPELIPFSQFIQCMSHRGELFKLVELTNDEFGFYDWLRNKKSEIIGILAHCDRGCGLLETHTKNHQNIEYRNHFLSSDISELWIFFFGNRNYDLSKSGDQDFGGNYLFTGENGSTAITFLKTPVGRFL